MRQKWFASRSTSRSSIYRNCSALHSVIAHRSCGSTTTSSRRAERSKKSNSKSNAGAVDLASTDQDRSNLHFILGVRLQPGDHRIESRRIEGVRFEVLRA